jgi:hypothetical protein
VFLPGGEILLAGEPDYSVKSHGFQLVVLGGTGGYAGVRGFVDVEDLRSGNSNFAFHLLP